MVTLYFLVSVNKQYKGETILGAYDTALQAEIAKRKLSCKVGDNLTLMVEPKEIEIDLP